MPNDLSPVPPLSGPDTPSSRPTLQPTTTPDLFDPAGFGLLARVPLIPKAIRRKHHVFVETDSRFRQAARFLQLLWRQDRDLPIGHYTDQHGKTRKLGSRIHPKAGESGANFMDPDLLPVVNRALIYRELGAVFDLDRLKTNLLASQALVFNAFGPLKRDLALATRFTAELLPGALAQVTDVLFETSPGRNDPAFTNDGTAFDLAFVGRTPTGQRAFIAVEVKYSESSHEPLPRFTGRFDEIAPASGLFIDPANPALKANPVQQSFRQLCLASTLLDRSLADVAMLLFIAPRHNHLAHAGARAVIRHLKDPQGGPVPFIVLTLEQVFAALAAAGCPDYARALHRRYTDFWLIDGELSLDVHPTAAAPQPEPATSEPALCTRLAKAASRRRVSPGSEAV